MKLVARKVLIIPFNHEPKTLVEDSALGWWLAMSQRHGVERCRETDTGACAVLVAHPDPMEGDPPYVTRWFRALPNHKIEWGEKYRGHRTVGLSCPEADFNRDRAAGLRRKAREGRWTPEEAERRIARGPNRSPVKLPSTEAE